MVISQEDHMLNLLRKALLLSLVLIILEGLHGVVAAFALSVFSSVSTPGS